MKAWLRKLFRPRPKPLRYSDKPVSLPRVDYRKKKGDVIYFGKAREIDICDLIFGDNQ